MKNILSKLSKEDLKDLSKAIQEQEKKHFGNPLSLRKQEQFMADIFGVKNWSTLLGTSNTKEYKEDAPYQKTIFEVEVLSNGYVVDCSLSQLADEIYNGDYSGIFRVVSRESLTTEEMSEALTKQGTDPEFILGDDYVLPNDVKKVLDFIYETIEDQYEDITLIGTDEIVEKMEDVHDEELQDATKRYNRAVDENDLSDMDFLLLNTELETKHFEKYIKELKE